MFPREAELKHVSDAITRRGRVDLRGGGSDPRVARSSLHSSTLTRRGPFGAVFVEIKEEHHA
jgi:hypothetical protein